MPNVFQTAAEKAFENVYIAIVEVLPIEMVDRLGSLEFKRMFRCHLESAILAYAACETADKLERVLLNQRAERAASELLRAFQARKDVSYAMERFWATFDPPQPPRLF